MNKKALLAIALTIAIIVVGTVGFTVVKGIIIKRDPLNHILYSATNTTYNAVDATMNGRIVVDEASLTESFGAVSADPEAMSKFVASLMNELTFNGNMKMKFDIKDKELYLSENMNMNYADKSLLSMGMTMTEEELSIGSDTLLDKTFVLTKQDIFDMIKNNSEIDLSQLEFDKYIDLLDMEKDPLYKALEKNKDNYIDILRDDLKSIEKGKDTKVVLSNNKKVNCDVVEINMSIDEMTTLLIDLLNEAKTDEQYKALVKAKVIEAMNLLISSEDYKLLQMQSEDITAAIENIETEFDTVWSDGLDELIYTYQNMQYEMQQAAIESPTYKIAIAIDSKYQIRQMKYTMDMMGIGVEQSITYNAFGDEVKFDKEAPKAENTIKITEMINNPEYASEVGTELIDQGLTNVIEGEALNQLMSDLEEKASVLPEEEQQAVLDMVNYFFENKDMLKDMILTNMGM